MIVFNVTVQSMAMVMYPGTVYICSAAFYVEQEADSELYSIKLWQILRQAMTIA